MMRWRLHLTNAAEAVLCLRIAGAIPLIYFAARLLPLPHTLRWVTPRRLRFADCGSRIGGTRQDRPHEDDTGADASSSFRPYPSCSVVPIRNPQSAIRNSPVPPDRVLYLVDLILDRRLLGIRPTCLLRSLVRYRFLRESGACARLHLGVAREGQKLAGHAWLTIAGSAFLEPSDPTDRYTTVLSYPAG
jgi:transglutaminase superfamily protein